MRRSRLFVGIVIALVATFVSVTTAWAYMVITSTTVSPSVSGSSVATPGSAYAGVYNGTAILSWTPPSTPSGATFTYTVSRGTGQGSVGGTCTGTVSGTTCTDSGLTPGTSYTWTITAAVSGTSWVSNTPATVTATAAGALSKLVVSLSPSNITAGQTVTPTVTAEDSSSRVETGYTGTITFSSSDAQAVLPSPNSYTFTTGAGGDDGTHVFTGAITLKTAPSQTITATDSSLSVSGTSSAVTVNPASANKLVFTTEPGSDSGTGALSPQPVVSVEDAFGNVEKGDSSTTVTLAMNTGSGTLVCFSNGSASSSLTVTVTAGVGSFSGCAVQQAGTGDKIQATSNPAHGTVVSTGFNVTVSAPTITFPTSSNKESVPNNTQATFTVTGTSFASGARVTISGGFTSTSWTWLSPAQISVTTTAKNGNGNKGTFNLSVTNPDGGTVTSTGSIVNS